MSSSSPSSSTSSGRRRRRGPRNGRSGGSSSPSSGGRSQGRPSTPKPKPTFFQKLLGMIGLGAKAAPSRQESRSDTGSQPSERRSSTVNTRVVRKPEEVEVTSPRLYIGNLSYDATEQDLAEVFNGVGRVVDVDVVINPRTQRSKGYAFVELGTIDEAKRAVSELHDKEFMGRKMVVSGAKAKDAKDSGAENTAA